MEVLQQTKKSSVSVRSIKLAKLNFIQNSNLIDKESIGLDLGFNASYQKIKSESTSIQFNFGMQLKLIQKNDNDSEINIGVIHAHVIGLFDYENELDEKLFPNLASILYSYLRPIVAQISVMAKLHPIDLPILNLSKIKVDEIKDKE